MVEIYNETMEPSFADMFIAAHKEYGVVWYCKKLTTQKIRILERRHRRCYPLDDTLHPSWIVRKQYCSASKENQTTHHSKQRSMTPSKTVTISINNNNGQPLKASQELTSPLRQSIPESEQFPMQSCERRKSDTRSVGDCSASLEVSWLPLQRFQGTEGRLRTYERLNSFNVKKRRESSTTHISSSDAPSESIAPSHSMSKDYSEPEKRKDRRGSCFKYIFKGTFKGRNSNEWLVRGGEVLDEETSRAMEMVFFDTGTRN